MSPSLLVSAIGSKPGATAAAVPPVAAGGLADWPMAGWSIESASDSAVELQHQPGVTAAAQPARDEAAAAPPV